MNKFSKRRYYHDRMKSREVLLFFGGSVDLRGRAGGQTSSSRGWVGENRMRVLLASRPRRVQRGSCQYMIGVTTTWVVIIFLQGGAFSLCVGNLAIGLVGVSSRLPSC